MFFNKALLATTMLIGAASTFTRTGATSVLSTLQNGHTPDVLLAVLTFSSVSPHNSKTTSAIFNGIDDSGDGSGIIHLSSVAFAAVEDNPTQTMCSPYNPSAKKADLIQGL
ncbi:hypothetical protein B0H10DRAFT_1939282 [Mycena sp. CBHHK59/15]|nr:hypothetical protein B0H10DRAFT_1939282 [Mycena sp. CBHHK59/15]